MSDKTRFDAFCSNTAPEVFHSVVHHQEIWRPDPLDVEAIHAAAREAYQHLLQRAADAGSAGRILLLLGESGAGKTHLMRVFRNQTHEQATGYFSYMQMTSAVGNYARYVLTNTLDSLDKAYSEPTGDTSGLMRLSNALAEDETAITPTTLKMLREDSLEIDKLGNLINRAADRLVVQSRFADQDLDLVRALLYLQREDPAVTAKVFKYLRCEDLSDWDRQTLGGIVPRTGEEAPQRLIKALASLMHVIDGTAFVICLDQLEDIHLLEDAGARFRRAIQTVIALAESPNVIVVVSCLDAFYKILREHLTKSYIDRVERDPEPVRLKAAREPFEIAALIGERLKELYKESGIDGEASNPLYPFPEDTPDLLSGSYTRGVIDWCNRQRKRSIETGRPPIHDIDRTVAPPPVVFDLAQRWNDCLAQVVEIPEDNDARLDLIAWSIHRIGDELPEGYGFKARRVHAYLDIDLLDTAGRVIDPMRAALIELAPQGGHLANRIEQLQESTSDRRPIVLRSTEFPKNPRTKVAQVIGVLVATGGRRVVVADSDWRALVAMQGFIAEHGNDPGFAGWLKEERPLSRLPVLRAMLDLDALYARPQAESSEPAADRPPEGKTTEDSPTHAGQAEIEEKDGEQRVARADLDEPTAEPEQTAELQPLDPAALRLGHTRSRSAQPVVIPTATVVQHAAFLGGSGSGKTTLALNLVEQLLLRGISALLVDRKGDLCSYARPDAWQPDLNDPARHALRDRLRDQIDVAVYTPGEAQGRPLGISVAPPDLGRLGSNDRSKIANQAAAALGGMMNYKATGADRYRSTILAQAIDVLSQYEDTISLDALVDFIDRQDPVLLSAIGRLDTKYFKSLVQDLETLRLNNGELFSTDGEVLDAASLLRSGDKPRLSIISTAFLGDNNNILFWIAQLLLEIARYGAKHPSAALQAVVMLDEADLYLPAQSKPATKEPLEGLLKRARSAGIGLLLSTQSPGDLDYKGRDQISSWFVGKVKETTAINKLKPMLSEAKYDVSGELANQSAGEFYMLKAGEVTALKASMSLIRAEQVPVDEILNLARASAS